MKIRLSIYTTILALMLGLVSCNSSAVDETEEFIDTAYQSSALLGATEDMGDGYIDSLIFIGESTTYHMKDRAVLRGGKETTQIWAPRCGTINLDMSTVSLRIIYPETNESITIAEAAARSKPQVIIFTFGLNGAVQNIRRGEEYYKKCYRALLLSVKETSPETGIIIQSAPPIAKSMDMQNYTINTETLKNHIDTINSWSLSLAEELGVGYLNTAEVLKDSEGFLRPEFDVGDGHHLNADAYREMLGYIRTHGYK